MAKSWQNLRPNGVMGLAIPVVSHPLRLCGNMKIVRGFAPYVLQCRKAWPSPLSRILYKPAATSTCRDESQTQRAARRVGSIFVKTKPICLRTKLMKSSLTQRIRKIYDFADLLENKPNLSTRLKTGQSQSRMRGISLAFFNCIW